MLLTVDAVHAIHAINAFDAVDAVDYIRLVIVVAHHLGTFIKEVKRGGFFSLFALPSQLARHRLCFLAAPAPVNDVFGVASCCDSWADSISDSDCDCDRLYLSR